MSTPDIAYAESYTFDSRGVIHAQRSQVFFKQFHRIFCTPDGPPTIACLACGRIHQIDSDVYDAASPAQQAMMKQYCLGQIISHPCDEASLDIVMDTANQYIGELATDALLKMMSTEINQALADFSDDADRHYIHER